MRKTPPQVATFLPLLKGLDMASSRRSNRLRLSPTLLLAGALWVPSQASVSGQDQIPINHEWLTNRVLLTWACDHFQGTNMVVVTTEEGLVVVDTGLSPTTVARQRTLVEAELGRSDFRYLINTHMHNDHAFANQTFPEATVIGPRMGVEALEREVGLIPELMERLRANGARYREWAEGSPADTQDGIRAREGLAAFSVGIADLEAGIQPRFPTATFDGRRTLEMGDLRLELFEFAGLHSDSDILILIPEERMLFTGDVFWGGQLPLVRFESTEELERLLEAWGTILELSPDLEHLVPGHSDVPLTVEQFDGMYLYLSRLWEDVQTARGDGTGILRFLMGNVFQERYPEVADFNFIRMDYNLHQHNIYMMWELAGEG